MEVWVTMEPTLAFCKWVSMQGREAGGGMRLPPEVSGCSLYFI